MTTYQYKRESKSSTEIHSGYQRLSTDYTETQMEPSSRELLPKYYPRDHEVTRWLVNQMRCRNGLHHFVNLANVQPSLLSAYFELYDQPHLYIDARTGPGIPAYSIKTVLYLTPLAIAVYFRLRSVLRLLLDPSGTRIHARGRQEIDVNATCYVRRTKPRPGPFIMDEYSTTYPAVLAVRREFFAGISILMTAGYHPQAPIGIVERLGTTRESTHWFVDLLDFCVKLLNIRPGLDVIGLLQTISYRTLSAEAMNPQAFYFDTCVYDAKPITQEFSRMDAPTDEVWCSVFHRIVRKGASRNYSNCGNRLISLLEHVTSSDFFRLPYMPRGPFQYNPEMLNRRGSRLVGARKMTPDMINTLQGVEQEIARTNIALDRDMCLCLLTLWLERVRNRCLDRQAQRLFRILTIALYDTELLNGFLNPPEDTDTVNNIYPYWLSVGMMRTTFKPQAETSAVLKPTDFLEEDSNDMCELEPAQVNEIRLEVGILGHAMGLTEFTDKSYQEGYRRILEHMPAVRGGVGDAELILQAENGKELMVSPPNMDAMDNMYTTEQVDRRTRDSRGRIPYVANHHIYAQRSVNNKQANNVGARAVSSPPPVFQITPPITTGDAERVERNLLSKLNERSTSVREDSNAGRPKPEPAAAGEPNVLSPELVGDKSVECSLGKHSEVKVITNRRTLGKQVESARSGNRSSSDSPLKRDTSSWRNKRVENTKNNKT